MARTNKHVHEIRFGSVKAAIWKNTTAAAEPNGSTVVRFNVTFARLYHDGKQWRSTESFGRDDLPLLIKVASLAHDWTYQQATPARAERAEAF